MDSKIYCYKDDGTKLYLRCSCGFDHKAFSEYKSLTEELSNGERTRGYPITCLQCKKKYTTITFDEAYNPLRPATPQIISCSACQGKVSSQAKSCPHCGQPINTSITCPKCGSEDIDGISGINKGVSAVAFGVFSANTVLNNYKCKKCGHKFK